MAAKIYGLYNVKEYEKCEYFGTLKEIALYIREKRTSLKKYITRRNKRENPLLQCKYELIEIKEINGVD